MLTSGVLAAPEKGKETKRVRFTPPPPIHTGFSSGSVGGADDLSRAAAFLSAAQVFLTLMGGQSNTNKGLITQLTDRFVWDKVTVKDRTTVLVGASFLGICGAVRMQESMNTLGEQDPLGLRERILALYARAASADSIYILNCGLRLVWQIAARNPLQTHFQTMPMAHYEAW